VSTSTLRARFPPTCSSTWCTCLILRCHRCRRRQRAPEVGRTESGELAAREARAERASKRKKKERASKVRRAQVFRVWAFARPLNAKPSHFFVENESCPQFADRTAQRPQPLHPWLRRSLDDCSPPASRSMLPRTRRRSNLRRIQPAVYRSDGTGTWTRDGK
jgi:hypothetical protein